MLFKLKIFDTYLMKNYAIVLLSLTTLVYSCKSKEEKPKEDTTPKVENRDMKGLKIAYYNSDSLKVNFKFFKEQDQMVINKQKAFQKEVERRTKEYQSFIIRNNEKLRNGMLSENEQIQIQQKAQQMEASLMEYQQTQGAKLEKETMEKLEVISKKIEVYGKQYSEEHGIDILLINGPGGQINFINPSMDVTEEFTNYLNQNQEELEKDIKK